MGSIRVLLGLTFKCGSSIYNDRYLITAAHCTTGESTTSIGVYLGSLTSNLGGAYYSLADIIYNGYDPTTKANDISLMKTASKITYSTTVQPLPLSLTVIGAGAKATAIGWGRSSVAKILLGNFKLYLFCVNFLVPWWTPGILDICGNDDTNRDRLPKQSELYRKALDYIKHSLCFERDRHWIVQRGLRRTIGLKWWNDWRECFWIRLCRRFSWCDNAHNFLYQLDSVKCWKFQCFRTLKRL